MSPSSQIPEADVTAAFERADQHVDGYLYALHFTGPDGEVVKAGRSINIESRFRSHHKQAKTMGLEFVEQWVSEPHLNIVTTEMRLLEFCREHWHSIRGSEWFQDAEFDAIVHFATQMPKATWNETRRRARVAYYLSATYPLLASVEAAGFDADLMEAES